MKQWMLVLMALTALLLSACDGGAPAPVVTAGPSATPPPTATPIPATVYIESVTAVGLDGESVTLRNNAAAPVNLQSWELDLGQGNIMTLATFNLSAGQTLILVTGAGTSTQRLLYLGFSRPIWRSGLVLTLRDASGRLQSAYRIP